MYLIILIEIWKIETPSLVSIAIPMLEIGKIQ